MIKKCYCICIIQNRYSCQKYLTAHRLHHNPARAIMCDQCGKIVYTNNTMIQHKKKVHGVKPVKKPLQCGICKNWYTGNDNLKQHIRNMHNTNEDKRNVCEICGFVSTTKTAKMKHKRLNHNTPKLYQCTVCERIFKFQQVLKVSFVLCKKLYLFTYLHEYKHKSVSNATHFRFCRNTWLPIPEWICMIALIVRAHSSPDRTCTITVNVCMLPSLRNGRNGCASKSK